MDITGPLFQGLQQDQINQPDDRGVICLYPQLCRIGFDLLFPLGLDGHQILDALLYINNSTIVLVYDFEYLILAGN